MAMTVEIKGNKLCIEIDLEEPKSRAFVADCFATEANGGV